MKHTRVSAFLGIVSAFISMANMLIIVNIVKTIKCLQQRLFTGPDRAA